MYTLCTLFDTPNRPQKFALTSRKDGRRNFLRSQDVPFGSRHSHRKVTWAHATPLTHEYTRLPHAPVPELLIVSACLSVSLPQFPHSIREKSLEAIQSYESSRSGPTTFESASSGRRLNLAVLMTARLTSSWQYHSARVLEIASDRMDEILESDPYQQQHTPTLSVR